MSPIVYVPHECEPPGQGKRYSSDYEGLYPEGTIWECDECSSKWELGYEWWAIRGVYNVKVIWDRLNYLAAH